jgi:PIN domain nuclease of toxin-antitoxin system
LIYVLDACAMIAFVDGEIGADVVEQALLDANSQCLAHAINLCEVFYGFYRVGGETYARQVIDDLSRMGVIERSDFDNAFWQEAGTIKAVHKRVSIADCFAIALTNRTGAYC